MSVGTISKKPVPPPAAIGAPASADKPKKEKKSKVDYPGLYNASGEWNKLSSVPSDFDVKAHKGLRKKDFENESLFLEFQASQLEAKAKSLREHAEKIRSLGSTASSAKAKTLVKMQQRMAELIASLKADGMDVDALLSTK